MGRFPAGKLRTWVGQPVNAPLVTPPVSLRACLILCILSVTGTLVYAVANSLRVGDSPDFTTVEMIFISVVYFVVPVLIAHTISVNRAISRPLIVLYAAGVSYQAVLWLERSVPEGELRAVALASIVATLIGIAYWLYRGTKTRVYYALVSGKMLPEDLDRPIEEILGPGRFERIFGRVSRVVGPYAEIAAVIIILFAVIAGLWIIS